MGPIRWIGFTLLLSICFPRESAAEELLRGTAFRVTIPAGFEPTSPEDIWEAGRTAMKKLGRDVKDLGRVKSWSYVRQTATSEENFLILHEPGRPAPANERALRARRAEAQRVAKALNVESKEPVLRTIRGAGQAIQTEYFAVRNGQSFGMWSLILPRHSFSLAITLTSVSSGAERSQATWERILGTLKTWAPAPRTTPQQAPRNMFRRVLGVLLTAVVAFFVYRVLLARRRAAQRAGGEYNPRFPRAGWILILIAGMGFMGAATSRRPAPRPVIANGADALGVVMLLVGAGLALQRPREDED